MQMADPGIRIRSAATEPTAQMHKRGYPGLADFMSESPEAAIFRKFNSIAILNILRLQAELQEMEEELSEILVEDAASGNKVRERLSRDFKAMRDFQHTEVPEEQSLQYEQIESIGKKLHEYRVAIDDAVALQRLDVPDQRNVELLMGSERTANIVGWLNRPDGGGSFLQDMELKIWTEENANDFMSLMPRQPQRDLFSSLLSGALLDLYHRAWGRRRETQDGFRRYSQERISQASTTIVTVLSSALPTTTVLVLFFIHSMLIRIGLVIVFTSLFSLALAVFSSADKATIFTATATFAAVEVVFVGSTSVNGTG